MGTSAQDDKKNQVMRLMVSHQGMLSAYLYAMVGEWELVEEALQETAVFMAERYDEFELGTNFGAWSRSVARMRCREILRRHKKHRAGRVAMDESLAEVVPGDIWDTHGAYDADRKQALLGCIEKLPERQQHVIKERFGSGRSCGEIAGRLERTVDAIYMLISRAKQNLKMCIERMVQGGA